MADDNYLSADELRSVADLADALYQALEGSDVSVGTCEVYDCNGDILGYIGMHEGGGYGFYHEKPNV